MIREIDMAKFCGNCGTKLEDNAAFCPQCGNKTNTEAQASSTAVRTQGFQGGATAVMTRKAANKKPLTIGLIAAAVIIVIIIIASLGGGGGYKGLIKKYFNAIQDSNVNKMLECMPPEIREEFNDSYAKNELKSYLKMIDLHKYKITDTERLNKDEIKDLERSYRYYGDIDISEAYRLEIRFTYSIDYSGLGSEFSSFSVDEEEMELEQIVIKSKGKWYVFDDDTFLDF